MFFISSTQWSDWKEGSWNSRCEKKYKEAWRVSGTVLLIILNNSPELCLFGSMKWSSKGISASPSQVAN